MVGNKVKPSNREVDSLTEKEAKRQLRKRRAEAHAKGVFLSRIRTELQFDGKQRASKTVDEIRRHIQDAETNNLMSQVLTNGVPEYDL